MKFSLVHPALLTLVFFTSSLFGAGSEIARVARAAGVAVKTVEILAEIPHDTASFTQGLLFHNGYLYESTGLYGESSLQQLDAKSGDIQDITSLPDGFFAEGLALYKGQIIQLTWQEHTAFLYSLENLERVGLWAYETEGWGLTCDSSRLIMSDGSATLQFRSPGDFTRLSTLNVTLGNVRLNYLNELEFANGHVFANLLGAEFIVEVDPATGETVTVIDASTLRERIGVDVENHPLNGIAHDRSTGDFYLTGKRWPTIFRVRFVQDMGSP